MKKKIANLLRRIADKLDKPQKRVIEVRGLDQIVTGKQIQIYLNSVDNTN